MIKGKENKQVEGSQDEEVQAVKKEYKPGAKKTVRFKRGRRAAGVAEPGKAVTLPAEDADNYIDSGYAFEVSPDQDKEV